MVAIVSGIIHNSLTGYVVGKSIRRKSASTFARKTDSTQKSTILPLRVTKTTLARAGVAVFGLGFIDAGYSGDWSRIGVISKESEDLLKVAAFLVVPFCIFLILSFSKPPKA